MTRDECPRVVASGPILDVLERWHRDLATLRVRAPQSDGTSSLWHCTRELSAALGVAVNAAVDLTLGEAHQISRIPVSTLRWMCNKRRADVGARKRAGVWYLDRAKFESYLASAIDD